MKVKFNDKIRLLLITSINQLFNIAVISLSGEFSFSHILIIYLLTIIMKRTDETKKYTYF